MTSLDILKEIFNENGYSIWLLLSLNILFYLSIKLKSIISFHEWNKRRKIDFYSDLIGKTNNPEISYNISKELDKKIFFNINGFSINSESIDEYYRLVRTNNFSNYEFRRLRSFIKFNGNITVKIGLAEKIMSYYCLALAFLAGSQVPIIIYIFGNIKLYQSKQLYYSLILVYGILCFIATLFFLNEFKKYLDAKKLKERLETFYNRNIEEEKKEKNSFITKYSSYQDSKDIYIISFIIFGKVEFDFIRFNKLSISLVINLFLLYLFFYNFNSNNEVFNLSCAIYFMISFFILFLLCISSEKRNHIIRICFYASKLRTLPVPPETSR